MALKSSGRRNSPGGPVGKVARPAPYVPKRGRPTATQVLAFEQAILAKAGEQFFEKGFDGASMEAIAAAAKVSKPTLYNRYPSKEALLKAFVERRIAEMSAKASRQNHSIGGSLEARLRHHAETLIEAAADPEVRALDRLLTSGPAQDFNLGRIFYEAGHRPMIKIIEREIAECTQDDGVPARDPARVALLFFAMLSGWIRLQATIGEATADEASSFVADAVATLLASRATW
jgi:TetR/AcrR family transcriptional repressor of mexJK operon